MAVNWLQNRLITNNELLDPVLQISEYYMFIYLSIYIYIYIYMYVIQLIQLWLTCTAIVPPLFPRVEDTTHARSVYLEAFGATFS